MNDILAGTTIILTDSRALTRPAQTTFIALVTPSGDGHDFVRDLFDKGVRQFIVSRPVDGEDDMKAAGARFIHTSDTTEYLQQLGAEARDLFDGHLVAVTGSRGKTIVKEWLAALLGNGTARSPRSFNSQIGVPLALIEAERNAAYGIFEAGVSETGDMARLEKILRPDTVIITNITDEHDSGFIDREEKTCEKLRLARKAKTIVYCADDSLIAKNITRIKNPRLRGVTWSSKGNNADVILHSVELTDSLTALDISIGTDRRTIYTRTLSSDADIKNLVTALTALYALKGDSIHSMPWDTMAASLRHIKNRLTVLEGVNNCKVIADRFTRDAPSLRPALDFVRRTARTGQPLTAILNCDEGGYSDLASTFGLLQEYGVRRVIVTGLGDTLLPDTTGMTVERFDTFSSLLAAIGGMRFSDETIYINSSGLTPEAMTLLLGKLEARQHETVLEVNLDAIVRNYNYFRSHLHPGTGIICMLKADGYGAGATEIAHTLEQQGVEAVAVAVADEGQQLREHGVKCRIMVLNPRGHDLDGMLRMNLEPVVYDLRFLDEIAAAAANARRKAVVHIKLETGMRRLGFTEDSLPSLISRLREIPAELIEVRSVFSHLATADCLDMDDYTRAQIATFRRMCDTLAAGVPDRHFRRHILNTAGILRFPEAQMDSCRLGIGLYGIPTLPQGIEDGLTPVSALYTTVISVKRWPAGATVGYGRKGVLTRDSVIATLPIGYADGIDRHFGNGAASMMVRGVLCPTVGNICMDLCMIDVTDCPGCIPGDRVEIFGPEVPVEKLSDTLGTIPYEILTSVSRRVKRVYFRE
ncbi:MAG: alanine racemase [Muribaculaceae bacterium]|nr:alanine racemase [Muribaculaceae bacterium]